MPTVQNHAALAAIYARAMAKIDAGDIPTLFIEDRQVLYRSINPESPHSYLVKPAPGGHVSKALANKLLIPADGPLELGNRFSGPPYCASITPVAGLYCAVQQQALVNESTHYSGKVPKWALSGRCVLQIRVMGRILVADFSPHNPRAMRFFRELGKDVFDKVNDPQDCSVARGIGLAIANSGFLGACVQTVRESERSEDERGDNLVLFAPPGRAVQGLYLEEARYYGKTNQPDVFPIAFP